MVRKHIGIERLLNMINIAHSMTKILPHIDNMFYEYRNMGAQEFRHKLNELINMIGIGNYNPAHLDID